MGVSRRAYAKHRGVSEMAVRKAIKSGRISVEDDGMIDPEKADKQWDTQTDPAMQRGVQARALGEKTKSAMKAVPKAALKSVDETLNDGGGEVSFLRAKMANEVLKAQTAKVRLQKMKDELVDRGKATSMVFDLARRERDAWQNWPPRVAADMAAELGVDAHTMEQILEKHLRLHLGALAEIDIELR